MAGLLWPIVGHATTQGFTGTNGFEPAGFLLMDPGGPRRARKDPFPGGEPRVHLHGAIDIGCPVGTPVRAPEAGRIVARGIYTSTGEHYMMLEVRRGTVLFFTHLSAFRAEVGDHVARGHEIALTGNTGMSTGPHLHWEVRRTGEPNPNVLRSSRWFKWNPQRLRVGGDLAAMAFIQPPGATPVAVSAAADSVSTTVPVTAAGTPTVAVTTAAAPSEAAAPAAVGATATATVGVAEVAATDDADDIPDDASDGPDDTVGDEAALHDVVPLVDSTHTPKPF